MAALRATSKQRVFPLGEVEARLRQQKGSNFSCSRLAPARRGSDDGKAAHLSSFRHIKVTLQVTRGARGLGGRRSRPRSQHRVPKAQTNNLSVFQVAVYTRQRSRIKIYLFSSNLNPPLQLTVSRSAPSPRLTHRNTMHSQSSLAPNRATLPHFRSSQHSRPPRLHFPTHRPPQYPTAQATFPRARQDKRRCLPVVPGGTDTPCST